MMFGTGSGDPTELPKPEDRPNPLHPSWFQQDAEKVEGYEVKEAGMIHSTEAKTITTSIKGEFKSLDDTDLDMARRIYITRAEAGENVTYKDVAGGLATSVRIGSLRAEVSNPISPGPLFQSSTPTV